jgi:hypothetical protein
MIFIVAAALVTKAPEPRVSAIVQATATIRVISGATLKLDGSANVGAPPPRDSIIKAGDGTRQPAKLIEFQ